MNFTSIIALTEEMILSEECIDVVGIIGVFTSFGLTFMAIKSALKSATYPSHRQIVPYDITEEISIQSQMIHEGRDEWDTIHQTRQAGMDTSSWNGSKGKKNKKFPSAEEAKQIVENNNNVRGFSYNENTGMTYFHHTVSENNFKRVSNRTNWTLYIKRDM